MDQRNFNHYLQKRIEEDNLRRINLIPRQKFDRVLDLGCADGVLIEPFIKNNTVYGIEISKNFCREIKNKTIQF